MSQGAVQSRLISMPVSHYVEKARWGLDRSGLRYVEERHAPALHRLASKRAGGQGTVPVLVTGNGVFADSTDILKFLDSGLPEERRLYPVEPILRAEVERLEDLFDTRLGPHTRRWAYFYVLQRPSELFPIVCDRVPAIEGAVFRALYPVFRGLMRRLMQITPESAERSRRIIDEVFEKVTETLSDGRRFLVGDRFSAADLAFAALSAAALVPAEYGAKLPPLAAAPPEMHRQIEAWRETPAGQFALRLYREERWSQKYVIPAHAGI